MSSTAAPPTVQPVGAVSSTMPPADAAAPSDALASLPRASAPRLPDLPPAVVEAHDRSVAWAAAEAQRMLQQASLPVPVASVAPQPMRINSLDALSLDTELHLMLSHSMRRVFKYLNSFAEMKPELELILGSIVFLMTIGDDQPTPGMRLQNLTWQNHAAIRSAQRSSQPTKWKAWWTTIAGLLAGPSPTKGLSGNARVEALRDILPPTAASALSSVGGSPSALALSNFVSLADATTPSKPLDAVILSPLPLSAPTLLSVRQKSLYFICSILVRYGWTKFTHRMTMEGWGGAPEGSWQRRIYQAARRIEQVYQAANILNFIVFLKNGCYRSLIERLLSIRLLYLRPHQSRSLSFEFMNQQIAWSSLSEFMLFLLPMINFGIFQDAFKWMRTTLGLTDTSSDGARAGCPVCSRRIPNQPYRAQPCGCVYCYYCLAGSRLAAQEQQRGAVGSSSQQFECLSCSTRVVSQIPA